MTSDQFVFSDEFSLVQVQLVTLFDDSRDRLRILESPLYSDFIYKCQKRPNTSAKRDLRQVPKVFYTVTLYRKYTWALTFEDFFFAGVHGACDEDLVRVSDVDEICSKYQQ